MIHTPKTWPKNKAQRTLFMKTINLPRMSGCVHIPSPHLSDPTARYLCTEQRAPGTHMTAWAEALTSEQRPHHTGCTTGNKRQGWREWTCLWDAKMRSSLWLIVSFLKEAWTHLRTIIFWWREESHGTHTWSPTARRLGAAEKSEQQALYIGSKHSPDCLSRIQLWVNNHSNIKAKYNLHLLP